MRWAALLTLLAAPATAELSFDEGAISQAQMGIFCSAKTGEREPAPGTVSGYVDLVTDVELRARTVIVPVVEGLTFGVRYVGARDVPDAVGVIRHPPFRGGGQTEQVTDRTVRAGVQTIALYTFDHGYEMVGGPWSMEVIEDGRPILTARFEAVAPSRAPDLVGLCAGEPLLSGAPGADGPADAPPPPPLSRTAPDGSG